jgi:two-component system, NarL family, sensor histidine kinase UhpB
VRGPVRLPLPLYWKVCLINGAVFLGATALLVVAPPSISSTVTTGEVAVLATGLAVIMATNATLLYGTLAPLDRLIGRIDRFDADRSEARLPVEGSGVAVKLASSFNALLERLEAERAAASMRAVSAQEAERRRIARELHDEVGQRLTVVLLGIKRALTRVPPAVAEELLLVQDTARSSLEEVRRLAHGLRPGVLEDLGLAPALAAMANELTAQAGVKVRRRIQRGLPPLTPEVELVIFRVAQEALTNATRHAHAATIDLDLRHDRSSITLIVIDDGRGIGSGPGGTGLQGMQERALVVGGTLQMGPRPEGGAEVRLQVPLDRAAR